MFIDEGEGKGGEGGGQTVKTVCMSMCFVFFLVYSFCFFAEQVAGQNSFSIKYSMWG